MCPVEGLVKETDDYCFIYDCKLIGESLIVKVVNLHYLTKTPIKYSVIFTLKIATDLLLKGKSFDYEINLGGTSIEEMFNELNPYFIESLVYLNTIINNNNK